MAHYLFRLPDGTLAVWEIGRRKARKVFGGTYLEAFDAPPGVSIWDEIRAKTPWFEPPGANPFARVERAPGEHYPFIARPLEGLPADHGWSPSELTAADQLARARGQLVALTRRLGDICQVVEPTRRNAKAYGHEVRNLLILASTEVEAHWRIVMRANGVAKPVLTRNDYMRLAGPMGLRAYAVSFPQFPWLPAVRPFAGWKRGGKLRWYDAYNAVKHEREAHFPEATLERAILAVTAAVVMVEAQYGTHKAFEADGELRSFFRIEGRPAWPPAKVYLTPPDGVWRPVHEKSVRG